MRVMMHGMSRAPLRTARIQLEPMTAEHLPLLVDLDADAEVLRYILGRARSPEEARAFWEPLCADLTADGVGLGWWVGRRRDDGEFLGWWSLSPDRPVPTTPTRAEAGWRVRRTHWRQGYATEAARALFDHGFADIGLKTIWAETMAVNLPSRRVMGKLGMRHVTTEHRSWEDPLPGTEWGEVVYEITPDDRTPDAVWLAENDDRTSGDPEAVGPATA